MSSIEQNLEKVLQEIESLPGTSESKHEKLRLQEKALEYIQALGDEEKEFKMRQKLLDSTYYFGTNNTSKFLIHFAWYIGYIERNEDILESQDLRQVIYWYKKLISNSYQLLAISKDHLFQMIKDAEVKTQKYNPNNLTELHYAIWEGLNSFGYEKEAQSYYDKWFPIFKPDGFFEVGACPSCVLNRQVEYKLRHLKIEETITYGEKLVEDEANDVVMSCSQVPRITKLSLAKSYLLNGKVNLAYDNIKDYLDHNKMESAQIYVLIKLEKYDEAFKKLEKMAKYRHFGYADSQNLDLYHCIYLLFKVWPVSQRPEKVKTFIFKGSDLEESNQEYIVEKINIEVEKRYLGLVQRFDERNQNLHISNYYSSLDKVILATA